MTPSGKKYPAFSTYAGAENALKKSPSTPSPGPDPDDLRYWKKTASIARRQCLISCSCFSANSSGVYLKPKGLKRPGPNGEMFDEPWPRPRSPATYSSPSSMILRMRPPSRSVANAKICQLACAGTEPMASSGFTSEKSMPSDSLPGKCAISGKIHPSAASCAMRPCMSSASRYHVSVPRPIVLYFSPRNQQPGAVAARLNGSKPTSPARVPSSVVVEYGSAIDWTSGPPKYVTSLPIRLVEPGPPSIAFLAGAAGSFFAVFLPIAIVGAERY